MSTSKGTSQPAAFAWKAQSKKQTKTPRAQNAQFLSFWIWCWRFHPTLSPLLQTGGILSSDRRALRVVWLGQWVLATIAAQNKPGLLLLMSAVLSSERARQQVNLVHRPEVAISCKEAAPNMLAWFGTLHICEQAAQSRHGEGTGTLAWHCGSSSQDMTILTPVSYDLVQQRLGLSRLHRGRTQA